MFHPVLFAGDPHGDFAHIREVCAWQQSPGTLILAGDQNLARPLRIELADVFAAGWEVRWIVGNHDTDSAAMFDNLAADHPEGDLHCRMIEAGGVRIAGLSGVFRGRVWYGEAEPSFRTRADLLANLRPPERWRRGIPLTHRSTIFPEDVAALAELRADVFVTHEAPTSHPHGFAALDDLAQRMGARLIIHGHHHTDYAATLSNGIAVRGLAIAQVWRLDPSALVTPFDIKEPSS